MRVFCYFAVFITNLITFVSTLASCSHRPPLLSTPSAQIKVYTWSPEDAQMLRAPGMRDDLGVDACARELCHVFVGDSYVSVKKLLIDLEEELRDCQTQR